MMLANDNLDAGAGGVVMQSSKENLVEVHPLGPGGGEGLAGLAADVNGQAGFFGEGVGRADGFEGLDVGEGLLEAGLGKADGDDDFADCAAGAPIAVLIMAADGFGQAVVFTEVVNGAGFAVVVCE